MLFELLNSLLKPGILKIVGLFLEFEVKELLLCLEELVLNLSCRSLAALERSFQLADSHLPRKLKGFSFLERIHRLPHEAVDLGLEPRSIILAISQLFLELLLLRRQPTDLSLEPHCDSLSQFRVLLLLEVELLLQLCQLLHLIVCSGFLLCLSWWL